MERRGLLFPLASSPVSLLIRRPSMDDTACDNRRSHVVCRLSLSTLISERAVLSKEHGGLLLHFPPVSLLFAPLSLETGRRLFNSNLMRQCVLCGLSTLCGYRSVVSLKMIPYIFTGSAGVGGDFQDSGRARPRCQNPYSYTQVCKRQLICFWLYKLF